MPTPPKRPRPVFDPDADTPDPAPKPPPPSPAAWGASTLAPGEKPRPPFAPGVTPPPAPVAPAPEVSPEVASEIPPVAPKMTPRQAAAVNAELKTPKVKPYHGSCPACGHGTMFALVRFYEDDVNENPTAGAVMPSKAGAMLFPGLSFAIMMISWIGGMTWDKGKVTRGRARVRKARAEILPRCPQAVICPRCQEVLERM